MPEFASSLGDQPDLDELARTDLLVDALAERQSIDPCLLPDGADDCALATLLEDWRDDLRWPPASALVSPEEAFEALRTGLADRRRSRRGLAAIGSVAATLLVLSGFGAVVVEARPGDMLYGLHAMFFDQARVNDDQIELSAKAELAKIQQMIDQGQWDQAHDQLAEVSSAVQSMTDGASRDNLMAQVNLLNAKVNTRDPNATLSLAPAVVPPPAPAATWSPPPSSGRHHYHHEPPPAAPSD